MGPSALSDPFPLEPRWCLVTDEPTTRILDPRLDVHVVPGSPGQRELVVSYMVVWGDDVATGDEVAARAVVSNAAVDDEPVGADRLEVVLERSELVDRANDSKCELRRCLSRSNLDVVRDWWRTGHGGEVEPIAEFVDRIVAHISLRCDGELIASAASPVVAGSWGALGED